MGILFKIGLYSSISPLALGKNLRTGSEVNKAPPMFKSQNLLIGEVTAPAFAKTGLVVPNVSVPVIASGGAGSLMDMAEVLTKGKSDAVLAASIFHYGTYSIKEAKDYLSKHGQPMRPNVQNISD